VSPTICSRWRFAGALYDELERNRALRAVLDVELVIAADFSGSQ
jgi:hypothetical protein